jgi:hypothetical protein
MLLAHREKKLLCHLIITASFMIKSSISNFNLSFVLTLNAEAALMMPATKSLIRSYLLSLILCLYHNSKHPLGKMDSHSK